MQIDTNSLEKISASVNTTPDEVIAQIFSWITPNIVFKFRRLNTRVDCILQTAHFAVLNQTKYDSAIREELHQCVENDIARLGTGFSGTFAMAPSPFQTVFTQRYFELLKSLSTEISWSFSGNVTPMFSKSMCEFDWVQDLVIFGVCGPIPSEISRFTSVKRLMVSSRAVVGSLPSEIFGLGQLLDLDLSYCRLTGVLPQEFTQLVALVSLDLSENLLEGSLPKNLGDLRNLVKLDLSSNLFFGPLPKSIGELVKLRQLRLGRNRFTGAVPKTLGNLMAIMTMDMSYNKFTGLLPVELLRIGRPFDCNFSNNSNLFCDYELPCLRIGNT